MKKFVAFAAAVTAVPALVNPSFAQTEKTPAVPRRARWIRRRARRR